MDPYFSICKQPDLRVSGLQLGTHNVMQSNYELIKEQARNISGIQIKLTGIHPPLKHKNVPVTAAKPITFSCFMRRTKTDHIIYDRKEQNCL